MSEGFKSVVLRFCESCHAQIPMRFVGEWKERRLAWYRCAGCHAVSHVSLEELRPAEQAPPPETLAEFNGEPIVYEPHLVFHIGQRVYHRGWRDEGIVIRKAQTSAGLHKIVVAFERVGDRELVEGLQERFATTEVVPE